MYCQSNAKISIYGVGVAVLTEFVKEKITGACAGNVGGAAGFPVSIDIPCISNYSKIQKRNF
jgi:hypothetical protein